MILYDFNCPTHGVFEELVLTHTVKEILCPLCSEISKRTFSKMPHVDIWAPITTDHVTGKFETYNTKQEFVTALNKKGLASHGLHNSYKAHNPQKWV